MTNEEITALLQLEMDLATGCTGPTAYALATACCREHMTAPALEVHLYVSPAYLKMGFGVATPGTYRNGIEIAAAVGLFDGNPDNGMQVLCDICDEAIEKAKVLADSGIIHIHSEKGKRGVYVRAEVTTENEKVLAIVEKTHAGISTIKVDDRVVFSAEVEECLEDRIEDHPELLTLEEIFEYGRTATFEEVAFLLDGYRTNVELAEDGIKNGFGLKSGQRLLVAARSDIPEEVLIADPLKYLPDDAKQRADILVSAASDGRMGGSHHAAMAAMGDGNQGLTLLLSIGAAAECLKATNEQTAKAMAVGALMLFYVKKYVGRAAAMCLCAIAAASGAAAGCGFLMGLSDEQIKMAVKNVLAPLAGMLCDGADNACALKMSVAAKTAFSGVQLAQLGVAPGYYDGIVATSLEETVKAVTDIANWSMDELDAYMVDVILRKKP